MLAYLGCSTNRNDTAKADTDPIDGDGDGFTAANDCDDGNTDINPDATETCDNIDNNCDGSIDEYVTNTYYQDADDDTYGNASIATSACYAPSDYVEDSTDCNDSNDSVYPGAIEICNSIDDNCDGDVDEDLPLNIFYEDSDGDAFGNAAVFVTTCYPSYLSYVSDSSDCDDTNSTVNPLATELCSDDIDQDCDSEDVSCRYTGHIDLGYSGVIKFMGEDGDDHAGNSVSGAGDVNGDGFADILVGAYGNSAGGGDAGTAYLLYGPITTDRDLSIADAKLVGEDSGDQAGRTVSGAGDVNGDGFADILVGAPYDDGGGSSAGAAYLLYGPITTDRDLSLANAKLLGEGGSDSAGCSISGAGDVDGDGFADILVGAPYDDGGGSSAGAAYLLYGPITTDRDLSLADTKLVGEDGGDHAGHSVSDAGDVNGDGFADILVGAIWNDSGGSDAGAVYLLYSPITADNLSLADAKFVGENSGDCAGWAVSGAGDVNGDGFADILVGASYNDDGGTMAGAAYLLYGPVTTDRDLSLADAKFVGENSYDHAGYSVSGAGNVDGDGFADILVGSPYNQGSGAEAGAAYLLYGPVTADRDLFLADAKFVGEKSGNYTGLSISSADDMDGDGFADILVGAYGNSDGGSFAGAAYLLLFAEMP